MRLLKVSKNYSSRCSSKSASKSASKIVPALMLLPACILLIVLVILPLLMLVVASLSNFNARSLFTGEFEFVGIQQYLTLFADKGFYYSLGITIAFAAFLVITSVLIGMWVAQTMFKQSAVVRVIMSIILVAAWAMPNVAAALVFKWMFQPGYGVVGWLLTQLKIFGNIRNLSWTSNTNLAFCCIGLIIVWQAVPYIAITLYAAQKQIAPEYAEAAAVDGASKTRIYWQITVPMLAPQLTAITILSCIWDFNVFNQIWLLTQGGPRESTATVGVFTYKKAFINFSIGQGSAISVVTTLILFFATVYYIRRLLKNGDEL